MPKKYFYPAAVLAAAFVLFSSPLWAQRASLAERVAQLEQRLNSDNESKQTLTDLVYTLSQLEAEVRELRGLVEDQAFDIENLRSSQRDQFLDLDRRLTEGRSRTQPTSRDDRFRDDRFRDNGRADTTLPVSTPTGATAQTDRLPLRELPETREPIDAQLETTGLGEPLNEPVVALADPVVEKRDYDEAFDALKGGRYSESSRLFAGFLDRYPSSEYSDNAQYWLAESYYATRNYRVALDAFQGLINNYPDSPKVPDARLKLGFTYVSLKDWTAAERSLQSVVEAYPDTTVSRLAANRLRTMRIEGHIQ